MDEEEEGKISRQQGTGVSVICRCYNGGKRRRGRRSGSQMQDW